METDSGAVVLKEDQGIFWPGVSVLILAWCFADAA